MRLNQQYQESVDPYKKIDPLIFFVNCYWIGIVFFEKNLQGSR